MCVPSGLNGIIKVIKPQSLDAALTNVGTGQGSPKQLMDQRENHKEIRDYFNKNENENSLHENRNSWDTEKDMLTLK